jgi:hypothetical protein
MMRRNESIEACPRCKSVDRTQPKVLLINRGDPELSGDGRRSWTSDRAFAVTDLKLEYAEPGSTGQFIQGMFCERCGLGYVPESMAKPPRPKFRAVEGGWRRANEDGTLGLLLNRMADDPDSEGASSAVHLSAVVAKDEVDWIQASRSGDELIQRHGLAAHIVAAELAEGAQAAGDVETARFWQTVSSSIKPRG